MNKKRAFILCAVENIASNYVAFAPSANVVVSYIASSIDKSKFDVFVVNAGAPYKHLKSKPFAKYPMDGYSILEGPSGPSFLPGRYRFSLNLDYWVRFLERTICKDDVLIVYHGLGFLPKYRKLKQLPCNKKILLVAEIYSDMPEYDSDYREKEISNIKIFDNYIFMSRGIEREIASGLTANRYIFLHGNYRLASELSGVDGKPFADGKVHCVYSGTPEQKKGLGNCLASFRLLPDNFLLHVFCVPNKEAIESINSTKNAVYEGLKDFETLKIFLQKCRIGLAVQNTESHFNRTSFPSKIPMYLSCGLSVVSTKSEGVVDSDFGDCPGIFFCDGSDPEQIKDAIIKASRNGSRADSIDFMKKVDCKFKEQLVEFLEDSQ